MLIKMKDNAKGCDDGVHSREYELGKEYEVSESLANNFAAMNVAEIVTEKSKQSHEDKSLGESNYQNKSKRK